MNDTAGDCTSKFRREHVQKHKKDIQTPEVFLSNYNKLPSGSLT